MTRRFSRRSFLSASLAAAALPAFAEAPASSLRPVPRPAAGLARVAVATKSPAAPSAAALIEAAKLSGHVAFAVADSRSGLLLESHEPDYAQPPASVTKTVTALYALDALGPGHRFVTRLIATGPVSGGVLKGDLILAGGGDPTLDTDALADMAQKLRAAGVARVSGRFLVWGGALPSLHEIDRGQPDHVGYNPAISGIALNFNRVHFEWKRAGNGWSVAMDARSERHRPAIAFATMGVVNRAGPVYTYAGKNGRDTWTVASKALGKGGSRWLPVRQPEIYAGEAFRALAGAQGITLAAPQVARSLPGGTALVSHASPELRIILRDMLKYSNNLTAEMVGLAASSRRGGNAGSLRASAAQMNAWAASSLGMKRARLVDHSGLGEASRLTAEDLTRALVRVRAASSLHPILKHIDMRDEKGRINRNHPVKVIAKTGTLNFVSCLAGYMTAPDGTELAFTIFTSDEKTRARLHSSEEEVPQGARGWNRRSKQLQQKLIERWATLYGT